MAVVIGSRAAWRITTPSVHAPEPQPRNHSSRILHMSRCLIITMGILVLSACSDDRSQRGNTTNRGSTPAADAADADRATRNPRASRPGLMSQEAVNDRPRTGKMSETSKEAGVADDVRPAQPSRASPSTGPDANADSPLTAGDQSESEEDRRITQEVRKAVVADAAMSIKAKNCTIITIGSVVTLRGTVDSASERSAIAGKAGAVRGVLRVDNKLDVAR